ncbi:hypothetical protein [Methylibium petroleiphilum]
MIAALEYDPGMANHPNRSKKAAGQAANPTPEQIRAARSAAGLTQEQARELIYASLRAWEQWEAGDARMHPGLWELFLIKTGAKA